jgi:peroxiredoxin
LGKIEGFGFKLIGVSADRVEANSDTIAKMGLTFPLYSDGGMEAANALGIAYRLDAKTLELLEGYGIDVEAASGHIHHILPVPATFVITGGVIRYMHVDPDHTARLPIEVLLAMLKAASAAL